MWSGLVGLLAVCSVVLAAPALADDADDGPTAEDYLTEFNPNATIVPNGELIVAGRNLRCGSRPTVLDPELDDYGAAYPGFLILNPRRMSRLPSAVQLWIHAHECAHQFRGPDEVTADCFAVQRGRRRGWLSPAGVEEICAFISSAKGSSTHYAGPRRCELMRKCFVDRKIW
ncbi:MAG: hypothetical protein AAGJ70_00485 [Pseudomonadota bacterium]